MASPASSTSSFRATPLQAALGVGGALVAGGVLGAYITARLRRSRDAAQEAQSDLDAHFRSLLVARSKRVVAPAADAKVKSPSYEIREVLPADAEACTLQMHHSFNSFNASVGLAPEFPTLELSRMVMDGCIKHDFGLVAVSPEGEILGGVFNEETDIEGGAVGCGPWSVQSGGQQSGVGRALVEAVVSASIRHGAKSIRLIQISANLTAYSLYTSLGFVSREPLTVYRGTLREDALEVALAEGVSAGLSVRPMAVADVPSCDRLHFGAIGISRKNQLTNSVIDGAACIVLLNRSGVIVGYNTGASVISHTIAPPGVAFRFLVASFMRLHVSTQGVEAAPCFIHNCSRVYPDVDRWLLQGGVRVHRAVNLMCLGEWSPINHEEFVYAPTITY